MKKKNQNLKLVDAPFYNYWQAMVLSFFSSRLYVDVGKRWRGYGILYFVLVFSLLLTPVGFYASYHFAKSFDENILAPIEQMDPVLISNGHLVFDKEMPYFVKNASNEVVGVIDAKGSISELLNKYPELSFLITESKVYFRPPNLKLWSRLDSNKVEHKLMEEPLPAGESGLLLGKEWVKAKGLPTMKWIGVVLTYPMMLGSVVGGLSILMLFLGFVVQLMSIIIIKFKVELKQACRLTMVGATPTYVLFFITYFFQISFYGQFYIYLALIALYSNYALMLLKRESQKMVFG